MYNRLSGFCHGCGGRLTRCGLGLTKDAIRATQQSDIVDLKGCDLSAKVSYMKGGLREDLFLDSGGRVKEKVTDMVKYEEEYCFFKQKVLLYCAQRDHTMVSSTQTDTFKTTLLRLFQG